MRLSGRQSLKLSIQAAVFKRLSLLIGGAKHVDWKTKHSWSPLGAGPARTASDEPDG